MDIGALQDSLQRWGQVDRIDVLLAEGATRESLLAELRRLPDWPAQALASRPGDDQQRIAEMSRAYRVNLTVLALDRKSTRLNSSHSQISHAVFCLKKKTGIRHHTHPYNNVPAATTRYPQNRRHGHHRPPTRNRLYSR